MNNSEYIQSRVSKMIAKNTQNNPENENQRVHTHTHTLSFSVVLARK